MSVSEPVISASDSALEAEHWRSRPVGVWPDVGTTSADEVAVVGSQQTIFLYRGGNDYYRAYHQADAEAQAETDAWLRYCDQAAVAARRAGARFTFFLIPNKASVLPGLYPLELGAGVTPRHKLLARRFATPAALPLNPFREARGKLDIFRRNDTHFTEYGNRLAMRELLAALGHSVSLIGFSGPRREFENEGDLGQRFHGSPSELVRRPIQDDAAIVVTPLTKPTGTFTGMTFSFENSKAPIQRRIAIFGNSFFDRANGWGMLPILSRLYQAGVFRWSNEIDTRLIEAFGPDDVVLQTCERFLGRLPDKLQGPPLPTGLARTNSRPLRNRGSAMRLTVADNGNLTLLGRREGPIRFHAGERVVAHSPAADTRPPLRMLGAHRAAIERFGLTAVYPDGPPVTVDLQEFKTHYYGPDDLIGRMYEMVGPGKWEIYKIFVRGTEVEIEGVVILPRTLANAAFTVLCEGHVPQQTSYRDDPGDGLGHWFMPDNAVLGFHAIYQLEAVSDFLRFELHFAEATASEDVRQYRSIYRLTSQDLLSDMPDQARIARVAGARGNPISFLNGGRTAYERLKDLAMQNDIPVEKAPVSVLDWGVGCGRVARFFAKAEQVSLTGADIDADNIEWCSRNLHGDYYTVPLMPPTVFESAQFDLIYSCSVLSHLTKEVATSWLKEMRRVLAADGVALISYNGSSNLASYLGRRPNLLKVAIEHGIFDGDPNQDLKNFISSEDYYRQTFATDEWWTDMFKCHFRIVDIARAAVSGHQDVAVLRHK